MEKLTLKTAKEFFENIATAHNEVKAFSEIIMSGEPFPTVELNLFLSKIKNIKTPFLLYEHYAANYNDNKGDTWTKQPDLAFFILDKKKNNTSDHVSTVLETTEEIGEDIMGYIKHYFESDEMIAKSYLSLSDFSIEPSVFNDFIGVRVDFSFNYSVRDRLQYDESKFTFS